MVKDTFDTTDSKFTDNKYRRDNIVRPYNESNTMVYPHLLLSCDKIERFKVEALKGILSSVSSVTREDYIDVYMSLKGSKVHIGKLSRKVLKSVIDNKVFASMEKRIYTDKENFVEGNMLYAFCSVIE